MVLAIGDDGDGQWWPGVVDKVMLEEAGCDSRLWEVISQNTVTSVFGSTKMTTQKAGCNKLQPVFDWFLNIYKIRQ